MGISAYLCKPGRLPQHVPQFLFCFSVLLPEDVTVWTINDRGLHTHTHTHTRGPAQAWQSCRNGLKVSVRNPPQSPS